MAILRWQATVVKGQTPGKEAHCKFNASSWRSVSPPRPAAHVHNGPLGRIVVTSTSHRGLTLPAQLRRPSRRPRRRNHPSATCRSSTTLAEAPRHTAPSSVIAARSCRRPSSYRWRSSSSCRRPPSPAIPRHVARPPGAGCTRHVPPREPQPHLLRERPLPLHPSENHASPRLRRAARAFAVPPPSSHHHLLHLPARVSQQPRCLPPGASLLVPPRRRVRSGSAGGANLAGELDPAVADPPPRNESSRGLPSACAASAEEQAATAIPVATQFQQSARGEVEERREGGGGRTRFTLAPHVDERERWGTVIKLKMYISYVIF